MSDEIMFKAEQQAMQRDYERMNKQMEVTAFRQLMIREMKEVVEPLRTEVASLAEEVKKLQGKINTFEL